jgi:type II secretory pathway component PulK
MKTHKKGSALITLIFFSAIAVIITSATVIVLATNSLTTTKFQQGTKAYHLAESGAEDAILKILRDPNYSDSSTLSIDNATVTTTVSGVSTKTIVATATLLNFSRKIEVVGDYNNNIFTITSWKEIN